MKRNLRLKRGISMMLAAAMVTVSLAGCGGGNGGDTDTSGQASAGRTAKSGNPKLTHWVYMDANKIGPSTDNYGTIKAYQELMKITGIDVEFIHPPVGQEVDAFSLMISGGEYPDMVHYDWGNAVAGGPDKAIEDGVILNLADLIEEHCPNLTAFLEEHPEIRASITTDSGNIYCFPNIHPYFQDDVSIMCNRGVQIRKDWLEELGLEAPETIDEWYTVLTAFKENITTEDGTPVIPLVSRRLSEKTSMVRTLANAWDGLDYDFYVDDGVVKYGPLEPEYKEYLQTMNQWYEEGLIAPEFSTYGGKEHNAPITTGQAGAWLSGLGAGMGVYITALGGTDDKIQGIPFPVLEAGSVPKYNGADNHPFVGLGVAITSNCKDVEAACKWLDYHYSEEGSRLLNWGIEGESYYIDDEGKEQLTDLILKNPDGLSADVALGQYAMVSQLEAMARDDRVEALRMWNWPSQEEASKIWNQTDFSHRYPPSVTLTAEEGAELAAILSDITTYRDENVIKYILGTESLDQYDRFVETIKNMDIERAIEIRQNAYDRLQARIQAVQ